MQFNYQVYSLSEKNKRIIFQRYLYSTFDRRMTKFRFEEKIGENMGYDLVCVRVQQLNIEQNDRSSDRMKWITNIVISILVTVYSKSSQLNRSNLIKTQKTLFHSVCGWQPEIIMDALLFWQYFHYNSSQSNGNGSKG